MRIRLTIEYDTDETLDYEREAWCKGEVAFADILANAEPFEDYPGDPTMLIRFEIAST